MARVKTNDSTPTTIITVEPAPARDTSSSGIHPDYREKEFEHWPRPSELELARLAAQLARAKKINPQRLVAEAWEVYRESCRRLQADHREVKAYHARIKHEEERDRAVSALPKWVPMPKQFPVTPRQVEALLLPKLKGRTADRAALIREFLFAQLAETCFVLRPKLAALSYWELEPELLEQFRQTQKNEVARRYEKFRNTVFDPEAYACFAAAFLEWHKRFITAKKGAAARKRWMIAAAKTEAAAKAEAMVKDAAPTAVPKAGTHSHKKT